MYKTNTETSNKDQNKQKTVQIKGISIKLIQKK